MAETNGLSDLKIEELLKLPIRPDTEKEQIKRKMLNLKVSSVSRSSQPAANAAAAVYVIDNNAIQRSGVQSLPEALRLAPGIDVARINNSKWAVTARGFNGRFANKLLVLIDGRSIYTSDFSGVYWDAQDVMLEDVERIEVIRGPGASIWGANAMNGVINIITKHAEDTQGGLLTSGAGSIETGFGALRYGKKLAEDTYARAYAKGFLRDGLSTEKSSGKDTDWSQFQGGLRLDSALNTQDNLMLQANAYQGKPRQDLLNFVSPTVINDAVNISGWNLTSKLQHTLSSTADYSLQFFYDHYERQEFLYHVERDTLDVDFQNTFAASDWQHFIWGLGYRFTHDQLKGQRLITLNPNSRGTQLFNAFIQDEISLFNDAILLSLGTRIEHNDYTGFEIQPSANLIWTPVSGHKLWASVSRAVRTPSRAEANSNWLLGITPANSPDNPLPVPVYAYAAGSTSYKSEQQLSYQLGYRYLFNANISLDLTGFYNDYHSLRSVGDGLLNFDNGLLTYAMSFNNANKGQTYGVEVSQVWQMSDWWRWDLNYSLLKTELENPDKIQMPTSPQHMFSLRSSINPMEHISLDIWFRYNGAAETFNPLFINTDTLSVNAYSTMDIRLAWKPLKNIELSLTGQNLLETQHVEYIDESYALKTGIPRAVYGKVSWQF